MRKPRPATSHTTLICALLAAPLPAGGDQKSKTALIERLLVPSSYSLNEVS